MNTKYNQLSIIGKVWTIGELFNTGIYDNNTAYIKSSFKKLGELNSNPNVLNYVSMKDTTLENIINNAFAIKQKQVDDMDVDTAFVDDGSIVSAIWYNKQLLDYFKMKMKENSLTSRDLKILTNIYYAIRRIYVNELKSKQLSSKERCELFKINEQVNNLKLKIESRVSKNQIDIN